MTTVQPAARTLDVRELAPRERHTLIFDVFTALAPGETILLVNDHDPKPLYYQFQAEHPGEVGWLYVEDGPEVWRVAITRLVPGQATQHTAQPTAAPRSAPKHTVDVRRIVPRERHPLIFATFATLAPGEALLLVNDHDPKPLHYQFQAQYPGEVDWTYVERGPEIWRVAITRLAPGQEAQESLLPYPDKQALPVAAPAAPAAPPVHHLRDIAADQAASQRWAERGQDTRVIVKTIGLRVVEIAMRAGQHLAEHRAPGEITIHVLQGQLRCTTAGADMELAAGDLIALAAGAPHAVTASADSVFLLTIAGSNGPAPAELASEAQ